MASKNIVQILSNNFTTEVKQSITPVLVDFWAEWCAPCRSIAPVLDELADTHAGKLKVAKVNIEENQDLTAEFGIQSIPTLLIFKNGEIKDRIIGAKSKRELEAKIAPHLAA